MRIVIDLQGVQTANRHHGIGRYSLLLAKAIVRNRGDHEIIIVLNGLLPDTIEPIRVEFDDLLPQENIRVWHAPGPVHDNEPGNTWRREAAELIREAFIANLRPDIVYISNLFDGYFDDAVTSIGRFDQTTPVAVSLYGRDALLPAGRKQSTDPLYQQYYRRKTGYLQCAALLLGISQFPQRQVEDFFGKNPVPQVNVSLAGNEFFRPLALSTVQTQVLLEKYRIFRPFVLVSGGVDGWNDFSRLIQAYTKLPTELREAHQLVLVGERHADSIQHMQQEAMPTGLSSDEAIFTGSVDDEELLKLYNLCKLFVPLSCNKDFGLSAIEAMACGTAVIGGNSTGLLEIIGREDMLFDADNETAIAEKLMRVLTDDAFRLELERHGLKQAKKYSWDGCAARTITALEQLNAQNQKHKAIPPAVPRRKMAYISPLPPERSGISDYSAELLPELSRYYDIDVIVAQDEVSDQWINANCRIRSVEWFRSHAVCYDRVLYHLGNSPFHEHMFALLEEIPGTVVLHDFYLSGIVAHLDLYGVIANGWTKELYWGHGYKAVQERFHAAGIADVVWKYPCSFGILKNARGVIVHSENSRLLAKHWYGQTETSDWSVIPLLRVPGDKHERAVARKALNLPEDAFVVCSFGLLGPTKLNHRLLTAWLASDLAKDKNCQLVFVGENHEGEYGQELLAKIHSSGAANKRIHITGWTDTNTFRLYLAAVDIGVQLRSLSRGETSAAVLDCMNYALPTIVNKNGSMGGLPDDAVWKIPDEFNNQQLIDALEKLWHDTSLRHRLAARARETILTQHSPQKCSGQYFEAIEGFYRQAQNGRTSLIRAVAALDGNQPGDLECLELAKTIAQNHPEKQSAQRLFLDVTATYITDLRSGIERVTRALLLELIKTPPEGYRIEPVYLSDLGGRWHYRYARAYTFTMLDCPADIIADEEIEVHPGDIVLGLVGQVDARQYLDGLHRDGVKISFIVFDLLPVLMLDMFPPGIKERHENWLRTIPRYDGAICISKAVADELEEWVKKQEKTRPRPFKISWFHLGADFKNSAPTYGLPDDADRVQAELGKRPGFLMIGTIEPRKGHMQTLSAFEKLWKENIDVNLVIVGKQGWMVDNLIDRLRQHPESDRRLFWLEGISDEYLEKVYAASTCLIAASEGEGFGLPLIEAAQHKLSIIARDLPVFREVAGQYAFYFKGLEPEALAETVTQWLALYAKGKAPRSDDMPWLTWRESAEQLKSIVVPSKEDLPKMLKIS